MQAKDAIKINIEMGQFISLGYLEDLTDQELLHRPAPGANHINWQLGHWGPVRAWPAAHERAKAHASRTSTDPPNRTSCSASLAHARCKDAESRRKAQPHVVK